MVMGLDRSFVGSVWDEPDCSGMFLLNWMVKRTGQCGFNSYRSVLKLETRGEGQPEHTP